MACAVVAFLYLSQRASRINKDSHLFARRLSSQRLSLGRDAHSLIFPCGVRVLWACLTGSKDCRTWLDARGVSL